MDDRSRNSKGFTIVELLIVIVVIAILAAISIVAYNGIQTRAENSKTVAAVSAWAKAIQLYKVDNGTYPVIASCLGSTSTYTGSYSGRCWAPETNGTWVVKPGLATIMAEYIKSAPEPSTKNVHTESTQYRGAMYYHISDTDVRMYVNVIGINSTSQCPSVGGLPPAFTSYIWDNGASCLYRFE